MFSKTFEEHLINLRKVFERLNEANLKLNSKKCKLLCRKVSFLGHEVSDLGIGTDRKIKLNLKYYIYCFIYFNAILSKIKTLIYENESRT